MSVFLLSAICARLGDQRRAELLYERMRPFGGRVAIARPLIVIGGPIDGRLGVLATLLGRYDDAGAHFSRAVATTERMGALPWQAQVRVQWAELLLERGDRERAQRLLAEAEAIARATGMDLLLASIAESRAASRRGPVLALVPRGSTAEAAAPRTGTFRRDGDVWTLVFEGRVTRIPHMLGLAHLARLLGQPGDEVHARDLVAAAYVRRREPGAGGDASGDAGDLLDARARADYQSRLREANEELAEAERHNDRGRVEQLGLEIELIRAELARGFGVGGRSRRASSANERARLSVTRAIKYAIDKIAEHDPALGEHLRLGVRTGIFCVYAPSSRDPVSWTA
jgi:hypothetical protein